MISINSSFFIFTSIFFIFSINEFLKGDKLDDLMSKHDIYCGESLNLKQKINQSNESNQNKNKSSIDGRIVGGLDAEPFEFPWQISLRRWHPVINQWFHTCGGAVISSNWIITAAHCFMLSADPTQYNVYIGNLSNLSPNQSESIFNITKIIKHSNFSFFTLEPDISLLKLAKEIDFSAASNFRPICFPKFHKNTDYNNNSLVENQTISASSQSTNNSETTTLLKEKLCVSTGWGRLSFDGLSSQILKKVHVNILSRERCQNMYGSKFKITNTMICSGKLGKGTCKGDSGGPLQCIEQSLENKLDRSSNLTEPLKSQWNLYGLASWALGCAEEKFPSVATNIEPLRDWIAEKILDSNQE